MLDRFLLFLHGSNNFKAHLVALHILGGEHPLQIFNVVDVGEVCFAKLSSFLRLVAIVLHQSHSKHVFTSNSTSKYTDFSDGIRTQFTGKIRRIRMNRDEKHAEEGVASITTNAELQRNTGKLRKIRKTGCLRTGKCNASWRLCSNEDLFVHMFHPVLLYQ